MKREEAYAEHTPTSDKLFAAEIMRLRQNTDFENRLFSRFCFLAKWKSETSPLLPMWTMERRPSPTPSCARPEWKKMKPRPWTLTPLKKSAASQFIPKILLYFTKERKSTSWTRPDTLILVLKWSGFSAQLTASFWSLTPRKDPCLKLGSFS